MANERRKNPRKNVASKVAPAHGKPKPRWPSLLKQIHGRTWQECRTLWLEVLGRYPVEFDLDKLERVSSIATISEVSTALHQQQEQQNSRIFDKSLDIASRVFDELLFLSLKSDYVVRSLDLNAANGLSTWAIFSSYHGAFFAAKAILRLLGVVPCEVDNQVVVLDLLPAGQKRHGRTRLSSENFEMYRSWVRQLDHVSVWKLLFRLLSVVDFGEGSETQIVREHHGVVRKIDFDRVSEHRNAIMYGDTEWMLEVESGQSDLMNPKVYDFLLGDCFDIDQEAISFSVSLHLRLCHIARTLIQSLGSASPGSLGELIRDSGLTTPIYDRFRTRCILELDGAY